MKQPSPSGALAATALLCLLLAACPRTGDTQAPGNGSLPETARIEPGNAGSDMTPEPPAPLPEPPAVETADESGAPRGAVPLEPGLPRPPLGQNSAQADPKPKQPGPPVTSALGGHERFLTRRPLDLTPARDFQLGLLASGTEPGYPPVSALAAGLAKRVLPASAFTGDAYAVAFGLYADALGSAAEPADVRVAAPQAAPGGGQWYELAILGTGYRVLAGALAYPQENSAWLIEHFELDTAAFGRERPSTESWDPYATPAPHPWK